jgi:hypothetical protein
LVLDDEGADALFGELAHGGFDGIGRANLYHLMALAVQDVGN